VKKHLSVYIAAVTLFAALAIPVGLIAQNDQQPGHQPHHYQLIDIGALGGSQSYFSPGSGLAFGQHIAAVNAEGTVAGYADTSNADLFQNYCFSSDCLATHTFLSNGSGVLTDLGALPGGGDSAPNWITANGLVAGLSENGETDPLYSGLPQLRAVLWKNGKIIDLRTLPEGGYQSEANSVNGSGQVVGAALDTVPDNNSMQVGTWWLWGGDGGINPPYFYQTRAFFWDQEHGMQDLGTLGGTDAQALLINEQGQVVGHSYIGSESSPACLYPLATNSFIWEKETGMVDLGSFGGSCTIATDLNQRGQVVGSSNPKGDQSQDAFLWERGQLYHLGGSIGGSDTGAFAISDAGEAVGFGTLAQGATVPFHATLWKHIGKITDLGVIGSDQCSYAAGINAWGQVVGSSISSCTSEEPTFRAFLWEDGMMFDLNNLIPAGSPLYLQNVQTINDRGEIAGQGTDSGGNNHAFLLIPCDENHPGVEGCDYSSMDVNATAAAALAPAVTPMPPVRPTLRLPLPLRRAVRGGQPSASTGAVPAHSNRSRIRFQRCVVHQVVIGRSFFSFQSR
jgi:probable HAF family extracellular repeat protein